MCRHRTAHTSHCLILILYFYFIYFFFVKPQDGREIKEREIGEDTTINLWLLVFNKNFTIISTLKEKIRKTHWIWNIEQLTEEGSNPT